MEVTPGFEPGNQGFADPCLTTWLCHQNYIYILLNAYIGYPVCQDNFYFFLTSEKIFYKGVQPPFPTSAPLCQTAQKSHGFSLSIER